MIPDSEVRFQCPSCQQFLTADVRGAGRPLSCPTCQALIVVPPPADGPATELIDVKVVTPVD